MKPEVKTKWLAALRSGQYPQARGRLRSSDGYCCLGVLCDIVDPTQWNGRNEYGPDTKTGFPDFAVYEAAGLEIRVVNDTIERLAHMNDNGSTFPEIAAHIEAQL